MKKPLILNTAAKIEIIPDILDKNTPISIDFDAIYGQQAISYMRNQNNSASMSGPRKIKPPRPGSAIQGLTPEKKKNMYANGRGGNTFQMSNLNNNYFNQRSGSAVSVRSSTSSIALEQRRVQKDLKQQSQTQKNMTADHAKIGNEIQLIKRESNDYSMTGFTQHLSQNEQQSFGDRIPLGFQKDEIIFKDKVQIIWLASKDQVIYAVKQLPKTLLKDETLIDQEQNYSKAAVTKSEFMEDLNDYWVIQKLEGSVTNLAQSMCLIKGENIMGNNRVY